jgi:hypothetical protein
MSAVAHLCVFTSRLACVGSGLAFISILMLHVLAHLCNDTQGNLQLGQLPSISLTLALIRPR